jgi:hypothetical protein
MSLNDTTEDQMIRPQPEAHRAVGPTYAPFMLALGCTMLFWGLTTSVAMSAGGLAIFCWALGSWIRDIAGSWSK